VTLHYFHLGITFILDQNLVFAGASGDALALLNEHIRYYLPANNA
jgi:hypothetical protein